MKAHTNPIFEISLNESEIIIYYVKIFYLFYYIAEFSLNWYSNKASYNVGLHECGYVGV